MNHPITLALKPIIAGICRERDELQIDERQDDHRLNITVTAALDDYRILIGRAGQTVHAIERLVVRAGERSQVRAQFELRTNNHGLSTALHTFKADPNFNDITFVRLLNDLCRVLEIDTQKSSIALDAKGRMGVFIPTRSVEDRATIADINNFFYGYGFAAGRKIDIKAVELEK